MKREHLDELIERRWRELGWDGTRPTPTIREHIREWLTDRSGELACYCMALACVMFAISIIAQMLAG